MNGLLAITIIFFVYAVGDMVASKTKAIISMMLVASVLFLAGFWLGIPSTLFEDSMLPAFSSVTIGMFLVNIGSTIKIQDFIAQWKTCLIALASTLAIAFGVYFIGQFIIDRYYALVGAPILAGGVVAYLVMADLGTKVGVAELSVFGALVLAAQGFAGFPIASILCKGEAKNIVARYKSGELKSNAQKDEDKKETKSKFKIIPELPEKYNGPNVMIFKVALVALLANYFTGLIQGKLNFLIICMIFGLIFKEIGFLEEDPLHKANAFSFVVGAALVNIFAGLANTTPALVLSMLKPLLVIMIIGVAACALVSILVGKILKESWQMSFAVGITALFGFPGTLIIPTEAAAAVAENDEERAVIEENLVPRMVISGMVSVSIVSGVLAGIMINWI